MTALLNTFWYILSESAIFILVGFVLAGALDLVLSKQRLTRFIRGAKARAVVLATLIGIPLPLCSCSVLPTALTLRRRGSSKGATLAFLIATPETSVTSILLTYALLGPFLAIYRPIAATVTAIVAGLVETMFERAAPDAAPAPPPQMEEAASPDACCATCNDQDPAHDHSGSTTFTGAMRFALVDLFDDVFGWMLVGILFAAALQVFVPPETLQTALGGPLQSMLLMVLIGVPLYVCAEASTPIAAVMIAQGVSPGAALVFLLVGPATNIGSLGALRKELGLRTIVVYLASIIVVAMFMGSLLSNTLATSNFTVQANAMNEALLPGWLKTAGAVAFLLWGLSSMVRQRWLPRTADWLNNRLPVPVSPTTAAAGAVALALLGYAAVGFFVVKPGQVAVVKRFGRIVEDDLGPGLHYAWPYPVGQVDRIDVGRIYRLVLGYQRNAIDGSVESRPSESWSLVGDENIADVKMSILWKARADKVLDFAYAIAQPEKLVRDAVLAASREAFAGSSINTVFTLDRAAIQDRIISIAQQRLDNYNSGVDLHHCLILDAHAPPPVHQKFREVASALENRAERIDLARAEEERLVPQARSEAYEQIAKREGAAAVVVAKARGQAAAYIALYEQYRQHPELTARRLEFEMLDRVLPRLRKYIKPPTTGDGAAPEDIEIWFIGESGGLPALEDWPP